jgi:hypothetical protein
LQRMRGTRRALTGRTGCACIDAAWCRTESGEGVAQPDPALAPCNVTHQAATLPTLQLHHALHPMLHLRAAAAGGAAATTATRPEEEEGPAATEVSASRSQRPLVAAAATAVDPLLAALSPSSALALLLSFFAAVLAAALALALCAAGGRGGAGHVQAIMMRCERTGGAQLRVSCAPRGARPNTLK